MAYLQQNRAREAIDAFEAALGLDDGDAAYWVNLGVACELEGELDRAEEAYRRGIERAPREDLGYIRLANLILDRRPAESVRILRTGVRYNETSFELRYALAVALIRSGEISLAREQVDTLLHLRPQDPNALNLDRWLEENR